MLEARTLVRSPGPWRGRRHRLDAAMPGWPAGRDSSGLGGALTAAFLGLLLLRDRVAAGEPTEATGEGGLGEAPRIDREDGVSTAGFIAEPSGPASSPLAAGSVLSAGALIDPALLVRLGGEARFDEAATRLLRPAGDTPVGMATPAAGPAQATAITVALGGLTMPGLPPPDLPQEPGEDLGPIGEEVVGGDGDDVLSGGPDNDLIDGGAGNDVITGGGGDDTLSGSTGDDLLDGGAGHDLLDGGEGEDSLEGGSGNDILHGGPGDDLLDGNAGDDEAWGGSGNDTVVVGSPGDLVFEDPWGPAAGGNDTLVLAPDFGAQLAKAFPTLAKGGLATLVVGDAVLGAVPAGAPAFKWQVPPNVENVRLTGGEAHAIVGDAKDNVLEGNDAANAIWGGPGNDRIRGGAGDDRLFGDAGDDLLLGDDGDDVLAGGAGDDLLYGGAGNDTYLLGLAEDGRDVVFDTRGANRIRFDGADPSLLSARLDGDDLVLRYDGRDRAVLEAYAGHETAHLGVEVDGRLHAFSDLLAAGEGPPPGDLLAAYLDPGLAGRSVPFDASPWVTAETSRAASSGPTMDIPEIFPGADLWTADLPRERGSVGSEGIDQEERIGTHTGGR